MSSRDQWERSQADLLVTLASAIVNVDSEADLTEEEFLIAREKASAFLESSAVYDRDECESIEEDQPADGFELVNAFTFSILNAVSWDGLSAHEFEHTRRIAVQLANFMGSHLLNVGPMASQLSGGKKTSSDTSKLRMELLADALCILLPNKRGPASIENSQQLALHLHEGFKWALEIERGLLVGKSQASTIRDIQKSVDTLEHEAGLTPSDISLSAIKQRAKQYREQAKRLVKKYG